MLPIASSYSPTLHANCLHFRHLPATALLFPNRKVITAMSFSSPSTADQKEEKTSGMTEREKLSQVMKYHNQTKHSFTNFARGPHGLDWANQPNPFRRYVSSQLLPLLHLPTESENQTPSVSSSNDDDIPLYSSLFSSFPPSKPVTISALSQLFYDSLALSAWKTTGYSTWSLRVNPSSGNLHPTESYIIAPAIDSICDSPFVAHYAPKEHSLELRAKIPSEFDFLHKSFPKNSFLIGISSIFWREAWKYGERAFRYCNHDVGHAIGAVAIAAAGLGWDVKILDGLGYKDLERLMGLHIFPEFQIPSKPVKGKIAEIEFEHPDCVLAVFPSGNNEFDVDYRELSSLIKEFSVLDWKGKPNQLSKEHVCWDIIYRTAEAVKKPLTTAGEFKVDPFSGSGIVNGSGYKQFTYREIVRKRRSAVDMDGVTAIDRDTFYQIMLRCLPSGNGEKQKRPLALPFRVLSWDAEVHAALFIHRVKGLPKGLYFLVRNEEHLEELKKDMRPEFEWVKPEGCPHGLPLYELARGDCQRLSKGLSCHQVRLVFT